MNIEQLNTYACVEADFTCVVVAESVEEFCVPEDEGEMDLERSSSLE